MAINFDDLTQRNVYKVGDLVEVPGGCRGCVERVVIIRNGADRRAQRPGKKFYELDLGSGPEHFRAIDLKRVDILDVLADAGDDK